MSYSNENLISEGGILRDIFGVLVNFIELWVMLMLKL